MSKKVLLIGLGLLALLLLALGASIYPDWLWFKNLGFSPLFWTILLSKFGFGSLVWLLLIVIIGINLYAARRLNPSRGMKVGGAEAYLAQIGTSSRVMNGLLVIFILILSFVVASRSSDQWDMLLRYLHQQPFDRTDPIFGKNVAFYLFSLPFYTYIRNGLLILFGLAALVTLGFYLKDGGLQLEGDVAQGGSSGNPPLKVSMAEGVKRHLIFLAGIILILLAWGFYLKIYGLLYSTQGAAFGAGYTDIHIKIWGYWVLVAFSVVFAAILFFNAFSPRARLLWVSGGIWLGAILIVTTLLPLGVQKFIVKPNELAKESPYIAYNIQHTREAFNLDQVKDTAFEVDDSLTAEELDRHEATVQNIRVWDERPLLRTYRQIQAMRLYYNFNDVDVDRYVIDSAYRQLMLSARELVVDQLPPQADTWVNRHLIYTHGYGLASSPVNEVTAEGLPRLFVKDLPPTSVADMKIERPEIYYGEKTKQYVMVNTTTEEFDYPKGDKNVYTTYQGNGGVPINSFFRRLLFAVQFLDSQILFTRYLSPESRIMFNRRVSKRAALIAPFLDYDGDPYLVASGGKLYWVQDAYTTSSMYPYSRRIRSPFANKPLNYIRNSVKVTIDAYQGDVAFYIMDEEDPIVQTYADIFPDLFRPFEEMPEDLKNHVRYPKDLFKIQVDTYKQYHMEDVQVFYNQEDLWEIPDEMYADKRQEMEPYYIIIELPGEGKEEFLLMLPLTPSKKDNMLGWFAARCDPPHYGGLVAYKLPKEKLVYGPMQIEARVDQQTEISRELSLWGQRGSRVIRGNLLAIPIGNTFIYVEPVYLEARQEESTTAQAQPGRRPGSSQTQRGRSTAAQREEASAAALPELKRVIVAFGNRLVMERDLDRALMSLLGKREPARGRIEPTRERGPTGTTSELGALALEHYNRAREYLRQGNWAQYGAELDKLESVLRKMERSPTGPGRPETE